MQPNNNLKNQGYDENHSQFQFSFMSPAQPLKHLMQILKNSFKLPLKNPLKTTIEK